MPDLRPWEIGDERARWRGYLNPDTGLLQVRPHPKPANVDELRHLEDHFVTERLVELSHTPITGAFGFTHLAAIHRHLFQDVYDWAGQPRTVGIRKTTLPGADGSQRAYQWFAAVDELEQLIDEIPTYLAALDGLREMAPNRFADHLAVVYAQLNLAHPFREGNGRTQRAFLAAIAREAGHRLDWGRLDPDLNDVAGHLAMQNSTSKPLSEILRHVVDGATPRLPDLTEAGIERLAVVSRHPEPPVPPSVDVPSAQADRR